MLLRLQLISTGQFFVMDSSNGITIDINSTVFQDEDDFLGSMSYAGKIPLEDNRALIQNAHFITTPVTLRSLDVMVWLGNLPWKQVKFTFLIEDNMISYQLIIDSSTIAKDMVNRKMYALPGAPGNLITFSTPAELAAYMLDTVVAPVGTYPVVFFPVKNDGAYKVMESAEGGDYLDIAFPVNPYMNAWQVVSGVGSFVYDGASDAQSNTQLPFFYLVYVLKKIISYYGYKPIGTWLNDPDANRVCIYTQCAILAYILPDYPFFMPDITVADFLKTVRTEFGLLIDFDQTRNVCVVESIKYLEETSEIIDLTKKQLLSFRELNFTEDGYTITQPSDDKDDAFSDQDKANAPALIVGNGLNTIDLSSAATKMINEVSPATVSASQWRIPYMKQPIYGATPMNQINAIEYVDRNNFKLRFFYNHGMQPDAAGFDYPYGSTDNLDQAGDQLTPFTLSLTPSSTSYQALQHKYELLTNSKPFEMGFNLSKEEFISMRVNKRVVVLDKNQATVGCILSSYTTDIGDAQTVNSKLTLYPIIRINNVSQVIPSVPDVPGPPVDNGVVYVKLQQRNGNRIDFPYPPPGYQAYQADLYAVFFSDAAGTIPKAVDRLPVRWNIHTVTNGGTSVTDAIVTTDCTGTEFDLSPHAPVSSNSGGNFTSWSYTLKPSAYYHIL